MNRPASRIDDLDRRIMKLLREDGRMPYKRIAREVNLSETAVRHRVSRMLRDRVFRISTVMDPYELGLIGADVMLRVRGGALAAVTEAVAEIPEADWVSVVAGPWNVSVELVCPDHETIYACLERIESLDGVEETQLCVTLHIVKHTLSF